MKERGFWGLCRVLGKRDEGLLEGIIVGFWFGVGLS